MRDIMNKYLLSGLLFSTLAMAACDSGKQKEAAPENKEEVTKEVTPPAAEPEKTEAMPSPSPEAPSTEESSTPPSETQGEAK